MIRFWLFRYYGWLAACAALVVFVWTYHSHRPQVLVAAGATILGFCYFVQQQKLAETALFERLFGSFNKRYDKLNGQLADMTRKQELSADDRKIVVKYFNLCAEEYLFYKEGYIHPDVWTAWCRGMLEYLDAPSFKNLWREEISTESFYGLSLSKIEEGAKRPRAR